VDAKLLETLGPLVSGFAGGAGKAMLARSPEKPLPDLVVNRPKTGFSLPMASWLSNSTHIRAGTNLTAPRVPWARRWAQSVAAGMANASAI
jgi:asparagine synthase (glutamine-hydrolysing)